MQYNELECNDMKVMHAMHECMSSMYVMCCFVMYACM